MKLSRPASPVSNTINYLGMALGCLAWWYGGDYGLSSAELSLFTVAAYAVPILLLEVILLRTPWRDSVGLDFTRKNSDGHRVAVKLIGVYGSYGFVALLYWLFPEYHGDYYNPYWAALEILGPPVLILTAPYIWFMDRHMKEPEDSYYWFGKFLLMDAPGINRVMLTQHLLSWVVKGFFLPLMFVSFNGNLQHLLNQSWSEMFDSFPRFYRLCVDIMFTLDLLAAVAGYTLAIRLFDTHFRSAEPTLLGWAACIICYQPFLSVFMRFYLAYSNNDFLRLTEEMPLFQVVWGSLALLALAIYTLASINFGCRFSNLTHRGVLTNGMYRYTKHPAYVFKNLFWWMTFVPFVPTEGWGEALRFTLLLCGISGVYYVRARTEEAHLSHDPAYVEYALYMNEHSVFRCLGQWFPFLRYKAPAGWEKLRKPYAGLK